MWVGWGRRGLLNLYLMDASTCALRAQVEALHVIDSFGGDNNKKKYRSNKLHFVITHFNTNI